MFNRVGLAVVVVMLVVVIIIVGAVSAQIAVKQDQIAIYPMNGVITHVSKAHNEITIKDSTGNTWVWGESEGWTVGNKVIMTMHNNNTSGITDDIILKVRYEIEVR